MKLTDHGSPGDRCFLYGKCQTMKKKNDVCCE